jgi:hypothetical protein
VRVNELSSDMSTPASSQSPIRTGRIPESAYAEGSWRIIDILEDFQLEDVWALPAIGSLGDFGRVLEVMESLDIRESSLPTRFLWRVRDLLGEWFGLGRISVAPEPTGLPIPSSTSMTVADRLPPDLAGTMPAFVPTDVPFTALYQTDREYAAEISNRTVHSIMHLAWADIGNDTYQAQMAVYVKPRGTVGRAYMQFIMPFRHAIVYPELMRLIDRAWRRRMALAPAPGSTTEVGVGPTQN